jgi:hypothetical protein
MNPKTLKALKSSIAHWTRLATGKARKGEDIFTTHCALCRRFYTKASIERGEPCMSCPVSNKTGLSYCKGSPWVEASRALADAYYIYKAPRFLAAARRELAFLKTLLPRKPKSK